MTSSTSSHLPETTVNEDRSSPSDEVRQRHPSTNSSAGEKQCPSSSNPTERSGENSRSSSLAESTTAPINHEGFSNYAEVIQHLQSVWLENARRTTNPPVSVPPTESPMPPSSRGSPSQSYHSHHPSAQQYNQYSNSSHWNNYSNPRRNNANNYNWNPKFNRFPSHRSVTNASNYQQQQQSSPPTQRRPNEQSYYHNDQQSYYKKNRSDHDRRPNGYTNNYHHHQQQQSFDYSSTSNVQSNSNPSDQSSISSTQSYPSHSNSYNNR